MNKILIIIFLICSTFFSCQEKYIDRRDFTINNIEQIDYIEIKNKTPKSVFLSKKNGKWFLNNGFPVNKEAIGYLLKTMRDMQIKRPVAVKEKENILQRMSIQRTKVSFFSDSQRKMSTYKLNKY